MLVTLSDSGFCFAYCLFFQCPYVRVGIITRNTPAYPAYPYPTATIFISPNVDMNTDMAITATPTIVENVFSSAKIPVLLVFSLRAVNLDIVPNVALTAVDVNAASKATE